MIMEVQRDSPRTSSQSAALDYYADHSIESASASLQSQLDQDLFSKLRNCVPTILVWLIGYIFFLLFFFFYFGSLPVGIYLLVIEKVTLGIVGVFCSLKSYCMSHVWLLPVPLPGNL